MRDYDEKRGFRRLTLDCKMVVRDIAGGVDYEVIGRDLSADGISFIADQPFAAGATLEIRIEPSATLVPPLRAEIEILRSTADGDSCLVAATITRML